MRSACLSKVPRLMVTLTIVAVVFLSMTCAERPPRLLGERISHGKGYRLDEEGITVVHLRGSQDEMREQYETLLADEIAAFTEAAAKHRVLQRFAGGCTNIAAFGSASEDGRVWHGRNFDFPGNGVMDRYRAVFIIEPEGAIPFVTVGWCGQYPEDVHTAMNAEGLSLGYMHAETPGETIMDAPFLWKIYRRIMEQASTIDEAIAILEREPRKGSANLLLADDEPPYAVVVEMTSEKLAVRKPQRDVIYATNHFVSEELFYAENKDPDTFARYERLGELSRTLHGKFNLDRMVSVLRDRYDVHLGREALGGDIIGTPANMLSVVFCPDDLTFWVAEGNAPAAYNRFIGFSLADELEGKQAECSVRHVPQDAIVGTGAWEEVEAFQAGWIAYLEGKDSVAVEHLEKAMTIKPCAGYGYHLGLALASLNRLDDAIEAFEAGLACDSLSSFCVPIYFRLGRIYETRGETEKMRAAYQRILALDRGEGYIEDYARRALEALSSSKR